MKIFPKLLLLLVACAAGPILILGSAGLWRSAKLGRSLLDAGIKTEHASAAAGWDALFQESRRLHTQVVERRALELEDFFEQGRKLVGLQTVLARRALTSAAPAAPPLRHSDDEMAPLRRDPAFMKDVFRQEPYTLYKLAPGTRLEAVEKPLSQLASLGDYYAFAHRGTPWLKSLYVGHAAGFIIGYPGGSPFPKDYDPRGRDWYRKALQKGRVTWSSIYLDKDRKAVITCAEPIIEDGVTVGVSAADVGMESFLDRLFELSELPATDALLVNYRGQVRISAEVRASGRFEYRSQPADSSPHVAQFKGGLFAGAFQAAAAAPSGTLVVDASGHSVADPGAASGGELLAFARVFVQTREGGKYWYYLVRTPMERVVGPAMDVSASLSGLQKKFSLAIDAQTKSLGLVLLAIAAIALLISLAASWRGAQTLTRPLGELIAAVRRVGKGDLETSVKTSGKDEIAEVGRAVNQMVRGLKEGLFAKETFKRYVSSTIVDQILKDPSKIKLGGEKKDLTVFFSDLSGFTALSETLSPEKLVDIINEYLSAMTDSIFLQEGTIDKYEGDAVMAFWGAPVAQPDHARRACWAALDNRSRLKELCTSWQKRGLPNFEMRIGINSGPMIVGNMGSTVKMDYTVMGDSVNIAARLEEANKLYGTHILISEATREGAGGAVEAREIDLLEPRGKKKLIRVYELLGLPGLIPEARLNGYRTYEKGLAAYRSRKWKEAERLFKESIALLDEDKPSSVMLQRTLVFRRHPPPKDWDGVFRLA